VSPFFYGFSLNEDKTPFPFVNQSPSLFDILAWIICNIIIDKKGEHKKYIQNNPAYWESDRWFVGPNVTREPYA
jgi:hypothetical protein